MNKDLFGSEIILENTRDKVKRVLDKVNNPIKIERYKEMTDWNDYFKPTKDIKFKKEPVDIFSEEEIEARREEFEEKLPTMAELEEKMRKNENKRR